MHYNEYVIDYNMHIQHTIRQPLAVTEFYITDKLNVQSSHR